MIPDIWVEVLDFDLFIFVFILILTWFWLLKAFNMGKKNGMSNGSSNLVRNKMKKT